MDEYITRNNAISAVCLGCNQQFSDEPCEPSDCTIRRSIMALPTADVAPRAEVIDEFVKRLLDAFPEPHRGGNLCPAIYYDDYREIIEGLALDMKDEVQK